MDQCLGQDVEASKIDFNKIIACYLLVDSYMLVLLWTMWYICHARVKHLQQIQSYHQSIFSDNTWLDSIAVSMFVDILVELSYTNTAASAPPREWYRIFKRTKIQEECFQAHFLEDKPSHMNELTSEIVFSSFHSIFRVWKQHFRLFSLSPGPPFNSPHLRQHYDWCAQMPKSGAKLPLVEYSVAQIWATLWPSECCPKYGEMMCVWILNRMS